LLLGLLDLALAALGRVATRLVCAAVLLHVVFAGKGLVALWAKGVLLACVLLGVASSVARRSEVVVAVELLSHGTRVAVLLRPGIGSRGCRHGVVVHCLLGAVVGGLRAIAGVVG